MPVLTAELRFHYTSGDCDQCPSLGGNLEVGGFLCWDLTSLFPAWPDATIVSLPESNAIVIWSNNNGTVCADAIALGAYTGGFTLDNNGSSIYCEVAIQVADREPARCGDVSAATAWDAPLTVDLKERASGSEIIDFELIEASAVGPGSFTRTGSIVQWEPSGWQAGTASIYYRANPATSNAVTTCTGLISVAVVPPPDQALREVRSVETTIQVAPVGTDDWRTVDEVTQISPDRQITRPSVTKLNRGSRSARPRRSRPEAPWTVSLDGDYCANCRGQALIAHSQHLWMRWFAGDDLANAIVYQGTVTVTNVSTPLTGGAEERQTFSCSLKGIGPLNIYRGW